MISGFSITINYKTYWVRCLPIYDIKGTYETDTSLKIRLDVQIYYKGTLIRPHKRSYVAEKVADFIRMKINDKQIKNFKELEGNKDEKEN